MLGIKCGDEIRNVRRFDDKNKRMSTLHTELQHRSVSCITSLYQACDETMQLWLLNDSVFNLLTLV